MNERSEKNARLLEALSHDDASEAASTNSVDDLAYFQIDLAASEEKMQKHLARELAKVRRGRLEQAREARTACRTQSTRSDDVGDKAHLLEKLKQLMSQFAPAQLQIAHRNLDSMPLEDLKSLIEDLERLANADGH